MGNSSTTFTFDPVSAAASVGNQLLANRQAKLNREYNERQIDKAYSRERSDKLADRDYENWYNSPAQIRQRLEEASMGIGTFGDASMSATSPDTSLGANEDNYMPPDFNLGSSQIKFMSALEQNYMDSQIKQTNARTEEIKANMKLADKNELRAQENFEHAKSLWSTEQEQLNESVRALKIDNESKSVLLEHNKQMFPILEESARLDLRKEKELYDDVITKSKQEIRLNEARLRAMAQDYAIKSPQEFIAGLYTELYGEKSEEVREEIMNKMKCDSIQAEIAAVNAGIDKYIVDKGVENGQYRSTEVLAKGVLGIGSIGMAEGTAFGSLAGLIKGLIPFIK